MYTTRRMYIEDMISYCNVVTRSSDIEWKKEHDVNDIKLIKEEDEDR